MIDLRDLGVNIAKETGKILLENFIIKIYVGTIYLLIKI